MAKIVIKNIGQLKLLTQKFRVLATLLPSLQQQSLERAANNTVLTDIHRDMKTNNFSKKIIDSTFVGPIDLIKNGKSAKIHFISNFVSDSGFDVSEGREEGTTDPDIFPKKTDGVLRFTDQNTGKIIFTRSAHPTGMKRLLIIEKSIKKNQFTFKNSYETELVRTINQLVSI